MKPAKLTPAQQRIVTQLARQPSLIDFRASPPIRRLLELGVIRFEPTAFGAGYVRLAKSQERAP